MRAFAQKQTQPRKQISSNLARSKVGTHAEGAEATLGTAASPSFGYDFSRIPIYPPADGVTQTNAAKNTGAVPPVVHEVINSRGQPLDATIRAFMEPRFNYDFGHVRVHSGPKAATSASEVGAIAYTIGQHVVIGERGPSPQSVVGQQLWAHELAHVVQQSRGGSRPEVNPSAPHERDAHAAAASVGMGLKNIRVACSTGVGLARATPRGGPPQLPPDELMLKREIQLREEIQEGLKKKALELLDKTGIKAPTGPSSGRAKRILIQQQLKGIASDPESPLQAEAKEILEGFESNRQELTHLNRELRGKILARRAPSGTAHFESAEAKEESTGAKAESATAKSEGAIAKVEGVAQQGETATAELGASVAKEGGLAAKVGNVLEAGLPGPQDVLFLFISFFGSLAEAKAKLSQESYSEGFARGAAAKLLGMDTDWVRGHLIRRSFGGSTGEQIAGFEGVKEQGVSQGAVDGYVFARRFTEQQIIALRKYGYAAMLLFTGARIDPHDDLHNVNVLGNALKSRLEEMLEEAQEAARQHEAERLRAEYAEELRKRGGRTSFKGHGWAQP